MKEPQFKKELFIAILFLIILLSFNFFLYQITKTRLLNNSQEFLNEKGKYIQSLMERRITDDTTLLILGSKLLEVNTSLSRAQYSSFFSSVLASVLDKQKNQFGAVDGIAYIEKVQDKSAYVARIRAEKTKTPFEFLYFNLNSINDKNTGYIFNYIEPKINNTRYFGYDAAESNELLAALKKSEAEDKLILTKSIKLFGKDQLFLIQPIYKNIDTELISRSDSLIGYIVLILSPEKLFDNIVPSREMGALINIKVYDNEDTSVPFYVDINNDNISRMKKEDKLILSKELAFADRKIEASIETSPQVELSLFEQVFPDILFIGGSVMIASFFYFMISFKMKYYDEEKKE